MSEEMSLEQALQQAPSWLLRPVNAFADVDDAVLTSVQRLAGGLPQTDLGELDRLLSNARLSAEYEALVNVANALFWPHVDDFFASPDQAWTFALYCQHHLPHAALSRIIRRMIVHPRLRRFGKSMLASSGLHEVSLSRRRSMLSRGGNSDSWVESRLGRRRPGSSARRSEMQVPDLATVAELRGLLEIRSEKQLGFLLSAVAEPGGAYTSFEIPKRGGGTRRIAAPCPALLWVQRRLHRRVLGNVSIHPAAHGFVPGRSTVTNAAPHVGARLVLKFDLRNFFPTIHEHRVVGLFASLGYHVGRYRYSSDDRSRDVAPVLARLCCVASSRREPGVLPQGAPTSPAISNLICRRLDERLDGLAQKFDGAYTRYADDLTFSFRDEIKVGRFRWWVDQICFQEGFTIRQDKFRAIRSSQRQQVTGIVVNERMNVSRRERRRFRAMLHQCRRDGVAAREKEVPGIRGYMQGFAAYVNMVDPSDQGKLLREVAEILGEDGS